MPSKKEDPKKVVEVVEEDEEDEEAPELEQADDTAEGDSLPNRAGKQTRTQRKYQKAMGRMGMKPEPGVMRVAIRKAKNVMFAITNPEVYKHPTTDTYVIFGEAAIDDQHADAAKAAVRQFTQSTPEAADGSKAAAAEDDEGEVSAEGLEEKDIDLVMTQAMVTRNKAIKALRANGNDIVNTIMSLTM